MTQNVGRIGSREWADDRKVQNIVTSPPLPAIRLNTQTTPKGFSTATTIAPAPPAEPTYIPLRATLPEPTVQLKGDDLLGMQHFLADSIEVAESDLPPVVKQSYHRLVLQINNIAEELCAAHVDFISQRTKANSAELDRIHEQKVIEIKKALEGKDKETTWEFFSNIMSYFLSAASVVLGSILVSTGVASVAGSFLIAAGGLGLVDRVAQDTGAYKTIISYFTKSQEMQQNISNWISTTVFFVTVGLGLTGGVMGNFAAGLESARASLDAVRAAQKLELALGLAKAGMNTGKGWAEKEIAKVNKALTILEGRIFWVKHDLEQNGSEAKNTLEMMQIIQKQSREAIAAFG